MKDCFDFIENNNNYYINSDEPCKHEEVSGGYKDLVQYLISHEKEIIGACIIPEGEFPALITHYVQSGGEIKIYGDGDMWARCNLKICEFGKIITYGKKNLQSSLAKSFLKQLEFSDINYPPPKVPVFTFIDLFTGIGGFRIAMQEAGGKCVFSCEWDRFAKETYFENFGEIPFGDVNQFTDVNKISDKQLDNFIPDHHVLAAGFPCQPFSIAGVSKKKSLGRKHGFEDPTQGTLFFDIKRILKVKKPPAFFLENVKNLLTHDKKRTFTEIKRSLQEDLGYTINYDIVDGKNWVPQHRERIFIVGYDPDQVKISKDEIIIPKQPENGYKYNDLKDIIQSQVDNKYTLGLGTWNTLLRHKENHEKAGNGFGYGLIEWPVRKGEITRTISARYHKDGAEILIGPTNPRPRRLTPEEAMRLQGFNPRKFNFPVSDTQKYRQIGNSVVIPAISSTAKQIIQILNDPTRMI